MTDNPFFDYSIDSPSFLERAEEQLRRFDEEENVSCLLHAALELRMGIESKLHESLDAAYYADGRRLASRKEYLAKKLLAELLKARPDAGEDCVVTVGRVGSRNGMSFRFTPVTKTLAEMHGKLGTLLHFSLFNVTIEWFVKHTADMDSRATLKPYRRFLETVCKELKKCNSGDLILPIVWRRLQNQEATPEPARLDMEKKANRD